MGDWTHGTGRGRAQQRRPPVTLYLPGRSHGLVYPQPPPATVYATRPARARPGSHITLHHFLPADPPALRAIPGTSARGDRAGELGRRVTVGVGAEPPTCRRAAAPPPAEERGRRRTAPCGPQGRATFSIASLSSAAVVVIAGAIWLPIVGVDPKISFRG